MATSTKVAITILTILVLASLALNGYLIWQLFQVQTQVRQTVRQVGPEIQESLDKAISDLESFEQTELEFNIAVQQDFPIDTEIPFNETINVPIQMTVPISDVIDTVVSLDLLGTGVPLEVPIVVPVNIDIPIDNTVTVPINRSIPISVTVPLDVEVPIAVDLQESEIGGYLGQMREGLEALDQAVDRILRQVN